jgi:hypothetical protein
VYRGLQLKRTEIENEPQNEHQEKRIFSHGFMVQKGFSMQAHLRIALYTSQLLWTPNTKEDCAMDILILNLRW